MTTLDVLILVNASLLISFFVSEVLHRIERQKLINKLMSKNFYEYKQAMNLNGEKKQVKLNVEDNGGPSDDFRTLEDLRF